MEEKRKHQRRVIPYRIEYNAVGASSARIHSRICNISRGGMSFKVSNFLSENTKLGISIFTGDTEAIQVGGSVVWKNSGSVGIKFTRIGHTEINKLLGSFEV